MQTQTMSPEFNLIQTYFNRKTQHTDLSVGDDAALISVGNQHQLAISSDMLVAGTHFFADAPPYTIGWKSLAVNISDMAAMSAKPKWITLAIALPHQDTTWLEAFANGLFDCAKQFNIDLIGGDTTRGPLTINVTIMGEVTHGAAITRSGAQINDDIWVSGELGSAALALAHLQDRMYLSETSFSHALHHLQLPQPKLALGLALQGIASSCIDISDGLLADLGHILSASRLGAELNYAAMPIMKEMQSQHLNPFVQQCVLSGGDDYELCFTAPLHCRETIIKLSQTLELPISLIGKTTNGSELNISHQGETLSIHTKGFDHFA